MYGTTLTQPVRQSHLTMPTLRSPVRTAQRSPSVQSNNSEGDARKMTSAQKLAQVLNPLLARERAQRSASATPKKGESEGREAPSSKAILANLMKPN